MKNREDKIYNLIEDYLSNRLPYEERKSFEDTLKRDPQMRGQVKLHEMAGEMIIENRLLEVRALAKEEGIRIEKRKKYLQWSVAVITIICALVAILYFNTAQKPVVKNEVKLPPTGKIILSPDSTRDNVSSMNIAMENAPKVKSRTKEENSGNHKRAKSLGGKAKSNVKEISAHNPDSKMDQPKLPAVQKVDSVSTHHEVKPEPCKGISIEGDISVESPCESENNGSINISNIRGGKQPYEINIHDAAEMLHAQNGIGKGLYNIAIRDAAGCEKKYTGIEVIEKICSVDYVFNASAGEKWKIPVRDQEGNLKVYNQSGEIVLDTVIPAGQQAEWDGHSNTDGEIYTGYLIFVINYSNGINAKGSITILR